MRKLIFQLLLLPVFLFSFVTGSHSATVNVTAQNFAFSPQDVTINSGDSVMWTNQGGTHTTTSGTDCSPDGKWDSGTLSFGGSFTQTFTQPGTYPYHCSFHCGIGMIGTITVVSSVMPLPTGQQSFVYPATASPVASTDPAQARPVGVGSIATGGTAVSIEISTLQFSGPADVYFGISAPSIDPNNIYLLYNGSLHKLSEGLVPWKSSASGPLNETPFGTIAASSLTPSTYNLYLAITPAGSTSTFYLYQTNFVISTTSAGPGPSYGY